MFYHFRKLNDNPWIPLRTAEFNENDEKAEDPFAFVDHNEFGSPPQIISRTPDMVHCKYYSEQHGTIEHIYIRTV